MAVIQESVDVDVPLALMVQMDFVPEGILERVGDAIGAPERRIEGDLESFKQMIEARGSETGAWRGEVKRPDEA